MSAKTANERKRAAAPAQPATRPEPPAVARAPEPTRSAPAVDSGWTRDLSGRALAAIILFYILFLHAVGLYTFTQGFLLTRVTIPTVSPAYSASNPPPVPARHTKAVILIIDALRTDFITAFPPQPPSPYHHGVLSLPAELTARDPSRSLIFNAFSDPPTSTMQRIKGITTGSLPTFIDVGSNFASTAVEEDSLIAQFVAHNKSVRFMGDDTWMGLFPNSFSAAHPYDSFNVEDLHTVDNGVIEHLIPYMQDQSGWDVLIGHFLGVDHVGHRVGPERETMRLKLEQMDGVLRQVVDMLDDETLLVVLGDHGMDAKGNHGGDAELETASALWMYSKGPVLAAGSGLPDASLPRYTYPGAVESLRHVDQIDLVPTLALLLGIPVPFNNLGSVIPECFADDLAAATEVNAEQIHRCIDAYGDDEIVDSLASSWATAAAGQKGTGQVSAQRQYAQDALAQLRALWAQFSTTAIILGSVVLALSLPVLHHFYAMFSRLGGEWQLYGKVIIGTTTYAIGTIAMVAVPIIGYLVHSHGLKLADGVKAILVSIAIGSELTLVVTHPYKDLLSWRSIRRMPLQRWIGPAVMLAHALGFASNSYIMWEDRVVLYLLNLVFVVYMIKAMTAPTSDMRLKLLGFPALFMVLTRAASLVTVCREEQQPYCHVTFYSGSQPFAPKYAFVGVLVLAAQLPRFIAQFLIPSKSLAGPARPFLGVAWRVILALNAGYWILEYVESWDNIEDHARPWIVLGRTAVAWASYAGIFLVLPYILLTSGLCITVERGEATEDGQKPVTVLGFANAYGSTYLLFALTPFALAHLVLPPMGQITLCALLLAALVHLEIVDIQRDAALLQQAFQASQTSAGAQLASFDPSAIASALIRPTFTDVVPFVLIGFLGFFATGHQAVLSLIQWKPAFIGFTTVTYPWSPLLVGLNTWGPFIVSAVMVPLLAVWNVSPRPQAHLPLLAHTMQLSLAFVTYHTLITLASAVTSAWLRRHLMVWKVFAPRFMLAGVTLLVVDLSIIFSVLGLIGLTSWKVWRTFKCESR